MVMSWECCSQARNPNAVLVLGRFWDAVLGAPPQNANDAMALSYALSELNSVTSDLDQSVNLLISRLQGGETQASPAGRSLETSDDEHGFPLPCHIHDRHC